MIKPLLYVLTGMGDIKRNAFGITHDNGVVYIYYKDSNNQKERYKIIKDQSLGFLKNIFEVANDTVNNGIDAKALTKHFDCL